MEGSSDSANITESDAQSGQWIIIWRMFNQQFKCSGNLAPISFKTSKDSAYGANPQSFVDAEALSQHLSHSVFAKLRDSLRESLDFWDLANSVV